MSGLKNILIVEDDADMRHLVDLCLRADGHQTRFAADGASAIGAARNMRPDLIVLDIGLPAGDGFTVMDRLNAMPMLSGVPVIVLSGRDSPADEMQALAAGAKAFLHKPLDGAELVSAVRKVLGMPPVSTESAGVAEPAASVSENGATLQVESVDPIREFLHDLRTPLAVVEGFAARLVEGEDVTPESILESVDVIHRNAKKLTQIVESFSDSYRASSNSQSGDQRGIATPGSSALGG